MEQNAGAGRTCTTCAVGPPTLVAAAAGAPGSPAPPVTPFMTTASRAPHVLIAGE